MQTFNGLILRSGCSQPNRWQLTQLLSNHAHDQSLLLAFEAIWVCSDLQPCLVSENKTGGARWGLPCSQLVWNRSLFIHLTTHTSQNLNRKIEEGKIGVDASSGTCALLFLCRLELYFQVESSQQAAAPCSIGNGVVCLHCTQKAWKRFNNSSFSKFPVLWAHFQSQTWFEEDQHGRVTRILPPWSFIFKSS